VRRIGVLMPLTADDLEEPRVTALAQGLQQFGWTVGRNVRIDYRWGAVDADHSSRYAAELVALAPDVILAGNPAVAALQQATRTVPIVFANIVDPVGAGRAQCEASGVPSKSCYSLANSARSRPRPHRSGWKCARSTYAMPARWSAPLPPSRVPRMAA
jgi:ABC-type uncharacterized transport system substrate-binding protein